ncbi:MAG: hypothetical protein KatS3mg090_0015 [Patescibacteria group bacterium]|nr:MAG: hypothetical protein KatS3mg090_0015 [Patescibacteria group bacterium]
MELLVKRFSLLFFFSLFTIFFVDNVRATHGASSCPSTRSKSTFSGFVLSTDPNDYNYWVPDGWFPGAESYSNLKRPVSVSFSDVHASGVHTWYQISFVVNGVTYYEYGFRSELDCRDYTYVTITPPSSYSCDKTLWMIVNPQNEDILSTGLGCQSGRVNWDDEDNTRKAIFNLTTRPSYSCSFNGDGTVDITIGWNWTTWADFFSTRLDENPDSFSGDCNNLNPGDECRDVYGANWTTFNNKQPNTTYSFWVHPRFDQRLGDWNLVMRRSDIVCSTVTITPTPTPTLTPTLTPTSTPTPTPIPPTSTPTPTPTARAWIKVKEAPFAELDSSSTNFNNNLPTNVIAVDSSDDNSSARSVSFVDSPDTNYEKHGVITLKNDLRASSMKTSVVDKGIFIKNYGNLSLNKFGSFQDFLDYVKKFKEYETVVNFNSTSLNSYQDGDIVLYEPTTGSSIVNLSSISNLSKNLILLINVNTVNVDVDNFNVDTVNDSIKNNIVLITKNLIIKDNVNKVYGAYFADSMTIEASSNPLKVKGMLSAFSNFNQNKTLITPANQKPALLLIYDLKPVLYHFKALSFFVTQRR